MQTYKNWHMYIIDDNSNDKSWSVIKKFSKLSNVTSKDSNLSIDKSSGILDDIGIENCCDPHHEYRDEDNNFMDDKLVLESE